MKKNLLWSVLILMVAGAIASCSENETENVIDPDNSEVMIYLDLPAKSRGALDPVTANVPATFTSGHMVFVDDSGGVTKHVEITTATQGAGPFDTQVGIPDLAAGARFQNVPMSSRAVHIYGNVPTGISFAGTTTLTQIAALSIDIATQMETTTTGIENVMLYGTNAITYTGNVGNAAVTIAPIVSRIEIGNIALKPSTAAEPNTMTGFRVLGIFLTNAYENAEPSGAGKTLRDFGVSNATRTTYLPVGATYNTANGTYPTNFLNVWYDYTDTGSGIGAWDAAGTTYTSTTAGKVWAYHAFASTSFPRIIIRVTDVTKQNNNASYAGQPRFFTIDKFYDSAGTTELTSFPAGKIYRITSVAVRDGGTEGTGQPDRTGPGPDGNITEEGDNQPVEVIVTVTVADWEVETVTPGLIGD